MQYKFRGKVKDCEEAKYSYPDMIGKWVEGFYLEDLSNGVVESYIHQCSVQFIVEKETVGMFTNLTDKNGKEIYEGDIIIHEDYRQGGVLNGQQPTRKSVISISNLLDGVSLYGLGFPPYSEKTTNKFKVIGNIHDNPELLTHPLQ